VLEGSGTKVIIEETRLLDSQVVLPMKKVVLREWLTGLLEENHIPASWSLEYDAKNAIHVLRLLPFDFPRLKE
jgi:hypothetical protein